MHPLDLVTNSYRVLLSLHCVWLALSVVPAAAQVANVGSAQDSLVTLVLHGSPDEGGSDHLHTQGGTSPRIGIVLSGGGARGVAQVGALKVFEELGLPIHAVVGTSIGGLVGGLYAAGYDADELDSIITSTQWEDLLGIGEEARRSDLFIDQKIEYDRNLLTLRLDGFNPQLPEAVSDGSRMTQFIEQLVWRSLYHTYDSFDSLKYRFRATATDLVSGRLVVFDHGNLALAMRAGATIPLRFTPVAIDSMLLVDGGLLANIPVQVARDMGCDVVIVVNTTSPLQENENLATPWGVADQVVTLMMKRMSASEIEGADLVITPNLMGFDGTDFSRVDAAIDSGEVATRRAIGQLVKLRDQGEENEGLLSNITIDCPDPLLVASLDLDEEKLVVEVTELRRRLDELERSGVYRNVTASMIPNGNSTTLILSGNRSAQVEHIAVRGCSILDSISLVQWYLPLSGSSFNSNEVTQFNQNLLRRLRRDGLAFARIDSSIFDDTERELTIYIDEGVIRSIRIEGLEKCAEFVVARELEFAEGELFHSVRAGDAVTRIMNTGYFKQAAIDALPLQGGGLEVVVRVQERGTMLMHVTADVSSERFTRLGVELAQENLFGHGTRLSARFAGGLRDRLAILDLGTNRIYGTYWNFRMRGYGSLRNVNLFERFTVPDEGLIDRSVIGEYRQFRVGATARLGRQVERLGMVSIEGRFERQGARGLTTSAPDDQWRTITTMKIGTRFDTQDRFPYAGSGTLIDVSYETSQHLLGADASFSKLSVDAGFHASVGGRHVIHPRFRAGFADATLPLSEQFSLGGQYSMFGLREDESRGRQMLLGNLEYRYLLPFRLYFDTYIGLRYDIGATWLRPSEIRTNDLEHGIGLTIGLDTPLGPADFALGRSFTFNQAGAPYLMNVGPIVAYFSLGFPFD